MSTVKRTATHSITFGPVIKGAELKAFLSDVPNDSNIRVDHWKGDQRDPAQTTITVTWDI